VLHVVLTLWTLGLVAAMAAAVVIAFRLPPEEL
jgi:hypothetical protein